MSTYNSVTPRALGASKPKEAPIPKQKPPKTDALPQSLTKFVEVCHEKASDLKFDSKKTAEMQLQLKNMIEKANKIGKLWENDWDQQELPIFNNLVSFELYCNLPKPSNHHNSYNNNNPLRIDISNQNSRQKRRPVKHDLGLSETDDDDRGFSSDSRKKARAARFERELSVPNPSRIPVNHEVFEADKNQPVRGTCQTLEKSYLRLTSAPDPSKVRPLPVLQKAFTFLMDKYKNGSAKYAYLCDQFKSIRQDLRVQLIENEFSVKVYETHARIAVENKDLGEFNQCQTVLKSLYQMPHINFSTNKVDFLSYRILYYLLTRNYDSISLTKLKLTSKDKENPLIIQALKISKAHIANNYHELFRLYSKTIGTTRNLLNCFIDNERVRALAVICSAYKILSLEFLLKNFHFENEVECMNFIKDKQIEKFIELRGDSVVYLNTASARSTIMGFSNQSRRVDIKGQI